MNYNGISNAPWARAVVTEPFVTLDGVLKDDEIAKIIEHCEQGGFDRAGTFTGNDPDRRRCDIKFFHHNAELSWLFDRMNHVVAMLNAHYYGFDLNGYEYFQYTRYNAAELGTYHWHMDCFLGGKETGLPADMIQPRKLSLTLALNDDYEGGEFQINMGDQQFPQTIPSRKGRVIAFPSYVIHTIRPVTKGLRRSIVIWVTGPKWR